MRAYFYSYTVCCFLPWMVKNMISIVGFVSYNHVIGNSCAHRNIIQSSLINTSSLTNSTHNTDIIVWFYNQEGNFWTPGCFQIICSTFTFLKKPEKGYFEDDFIWALSYLPSPRLLQSPLLRATGQYNPTSEFGLIVLWMLLYAPALPAQVGGIHSCVGASLKIALSWRELPSDG